MPQRGSTSGTLTHQPAGVHDLELHSKDDTHSTATLHVRHALSGSGLEGDLGERGNRDSNADHHAIDLRLTILYAFVPTLGGQL